MDNQQLIESLEYHAYELCEDKEAADRKRAIRRQKLGEALEKIKDCLKQFDLPFIRPYIEMESEFSNFYNITLEDEPPFIRRSYFSDKQKKYKMYVKFWGDLKECQNLIKHLIDEDGYNRSDALHIFAREYINDLEYFISQIKVMQQVTKGIKDNFEKYWDHHQKDLDSAPEIDKYYVKDYFADRCNRILHALGLTLRYYNSHLKECQKIKAEIKATPEIASYL